MFSLWRAESCVHVSLPVPSCLLLVWESKEVHDFSSICMYRCDTGAAVVHITYICMYYTLWGYHACCSLSLSLSLSPCIHKSVDSVSPHMHSTQYPAHCHMLHISHITSSHLHVSHITSSHATHTCAHTYVHVTIEVHMVCTNRMAYCHQDQHVPTTCTYIHVCNDMHA